jgi:molecular chaperone HtpG
MAAKKSTRKFKTEVSELLDLIIHSLYSHKEIFLRELVSNASDAIDRLKFKAQTDPALTGDDTDYEIKLVIDAKAGTLEVRDNGIGMTQEEVVANIGTIAKSGTAEFMAALKKSKEATGLNPELIGQFGVGFYSSFMVAEKITLITRSAGTDKGVKWESTGTESYTIEEVDGAERGTRVILHLRQPEEGEDDYAAEWTLKKTIKKHSDFVAYPITLDGVEKIPVTDDEGKPVEGKFIDQPKTDVLNSMKAIWSRAKSDVTDEEYNEFYKHVSHDWTAPMSRLHLKLEGTNEFDALLYIPQKRPMDIYRPDRKHGIHLYCKRVFIMDDCKELVPEYLRFVQGVVDSADLNLNVSREILQEDRIVRAIKSSLIRKVLDHLEAMEADEFKTFYDEFGIILKEGVYLDPERKERLSKLVRFATTKSGGELKSLEQYVADMKEDQEDIYYLTGVNAEALADNPLLEKLRSMDYEVLLMTDPVDEFVSDVLTEFDGKKLKSAEKGDLGLDDTEKTEELKTEYADLVAFLKESLSDEVSDVHISDRLTDSAVCLAADENQMSAMMLRMMKASGQEMGDVKRVLEINPTHALIQAVEAAFKADAEDPELAANAQLLYELAMVGEGAALKNPAKFAKQMGELAARALGK